MDAQDNTALVAGAIILWLLWKRKTPSVVMVPYDSSQSMLVTNTNQPVIISGNTPVLR